MARAHYSVVDVLRGLPIPHRNWLFEKFRTKMPEGRLIDPKIDRLAELLGPKDVNYYNSLYLHKGGLLSWFHFANATKDTRSVQAALAKSHPGIEGNDLRPKLEWDADPVLYSMERRDKDTLVLQLAALDAEREYRSNWEAKTIRYDTNYVIVLRDGSFTIEVRSAYGKLAQLYRVVSSAIGLKLHDGVECKLTEQADRNRLKRLLSARCFFAQHRHDTLEVVKSTVEAHPKHDLEKGDRLKTIEKEAGVTGFSRSYDFRFKHPDGYEEVCVYRVRLSSGQVRVEKEMSEPAIRVLQQHVVQLF